MCFIISILYNVVEEVRQYKFLVTLAVPLDMWQFHLRGICF